MACELAGSLILKREQEKRRYWVHPFWGSKFVCLKNLMNRDKAPFFNEIYNSSIALMIVFRFELQKCYK